MSRAQAFFRPVPVDSPVHRLAPEAKVLSGIFVSIGLVFNPQWSHVLVALALVIGVFKLARLPRSVLPKIPVIVRFALIGGAMGAFASGEDPFVAGIGIGGLLDYARLITVGIVMILWAGILSWTTGLTAVGFAIRRLLQPLGKLGLPVDEIGSVVALAVRSLPLVTDEIEVVNESVSNRPPPADLSDKPMREAFSYIGDIATAVVIGSHRRARDLATAMVSRGATTAPRPNRPPLRKIDIFVTFAALALSLAAFLIPGWPEITPDS
jgi:energy-coupling factor transporter transmembrane protein EcfT